MKQIMMWQSQNNGIVEQRISELTDSTTYNNGVDSVIRTHKQRHHIARADGHQGADWVWCPAADLVWVSSGGSGGLVWLCSGGAVAQATRSSGFRVDVDGADGAKARCSCGQVRAARVRRASKTAMQWSARHQVAMRVTSRMQRRRTVVTPASLRRGRQQRSSGQMTDGGGGEAERVGRRGGGLADRRVQRTIA
ncbi:hypothetical protein Syun_003836 [Stephania yunnanensis]|uniref:Uncharacterized protein n=1 Tax=Stephania yunnanensis TaxID=152371 RepID=A0AAP0L4R6_9MAGN